MKSFLLFLILLAAAFVPARATPPMISYPMPRPVEIKFDFEPAVLKSGTGRVTVRLTSQIGVTRNITLRFTCSGDIKITPASGDIALIEEGKTVEFILTVSHGVKPAANFASSWLQLTYSLVPDYAKMQETVRADQKTYPNLTLREALCRKLEKAIQEKRTYRDSMTYNLGN